MVEFSTRGDFGSRSLNSWLAIVEDPNLVDGIITTLAIAALTVVGMLVLLVPTMAWTYRPGPALKRPVEFLCLLPLAIPAIVLVVGIVPIYHSMASPGATRGNPADARLHRHHPRAAVCAPGHRREPAVDRRRRRSPRRPAAWAPAGRGRCSRSSPRTCAARSCRRRSSPIALVLGEYTISSLLTFDTLQVVIFLLGKRDPFMAVAVSLAALIFAFVLLFVIARVAPGPKATQRAPEEEPAT